MANILIKQGKEIAGSNLVTPSTKADKVDLTSIIQTGTTSSQAMSAGTYFYLNDTLVRAKVAIANGATFTLNTNYEVVTAGALNELVNALSAQDITSRVTVSLGSAKVIKVGKIVSVSWYAGADTVPANVVTTLISGLPIPLIIEPNCTMPTGFILDASGTGLGYSPENVVLYVTSDGRLNITPKFSFTAYRGTYITYISE